MGSRPPSREPVWRCVAARESRESQDFLRAARYATDKCSPPPFRQTYDYDSFAGPATEGEGSSVEASCALTPEERTGASELAAALAAPGGAAVLDVRSTEQHAMAALPGSTSIPFDALAERVAEAAALVPADGRLFVVCRRGNDSQRAVRLLRAAGVQGDVVDVRGGLAAFAREVPGGGFPAY